MHRFFNEERSKERIDEARGYLGYNKNCGLAVVKMGIVDRDYGSKSTEDTLIDFLENKWYAEEVDDFTDSVDIEQWLQNLAVYAVMLNMDSPIRNINNWYLATTNRGVDDWKIVQYDHHGIMTKSMVNYGCDYSCGDRMAYWSMLRPTCGSVKDHQLVGRILNSEENVQKYLNYVQDYIDALATDNILTKLYDYGNSIKKYVMDDPWNHYSTVGDYEGSELGTNIEDYNTDEAPFLKTLQVRLQQVQKQLVAIQEGTLPLDGAYDEGAVCSDWRENFISSAGYYYLGSIRCRLS